MASRRLPSGYGFAKASNQAEPQSLKPRRLAGAHVQGKSGQTGTETHPSTKTAPRPSQDPLDQAGCLLLRRYARSNVYMELILG